MEEEEMEVEGDGGRGRGQRGETGGAGENWKRVVEGGLSSGGSGPS